MSNTFVASTLVSKDAAVHFKNFNTFISTGQMTFSEMWQNGQYDAGDSISVRLDNQFQVKRGDTVTVGEVQEQTRALTLQPLYSVPVEYTTTDFTKNMYHGWSDRVLKPAVQNLISKMNADIATAAVTQLNYYGANAISASINSFADIEDPGTILLDLGVPLDEKWYFALTPKDKSAVGSALQNSFNPTLNEEISFGSRLGRLSYFDIMMDQSIATYTPGIALGTDNLINDTSISDGDSTLVLDGIDNDGTLVAGMAFSVDNSVVSGAALCKSVNRITKASTGRDMQFVVTANATISSGAATITVSPTMRDNTVPELQNVSSLPVDNASITWSAGTDTNHKVNTAYTRNGLQLAMPPLAELDTPESSTFTDKDSGISIRVSKSAEILNNKNILRLDALLGYVWMPEQAIRVHSAV